jgi:short-subunit dehydrogenase
MATFEGQVALVTGASSGIGEAVARELARRGADVALLARRTDRLEKVAGEIAQSGRRAVAIACDVTRDGDCEKAVEKAKRELGRIDIVVANAGFGVVGRFEKLTLADYRRQFETNVFGVLRTLYAAVEEVKRTKGRFVIMGSVSGHVSIPGTSAYAMSKFAVRALAEALSYELAPSGVSTILISPGFVESEIRSVDNRGQHHPEARDSVQRRFVMPTDKAARQIVTAIARRSREKVITRVGKTAVFFNRHTPWLVKTIVSKAGVGGRKEPKRLPT